MSWSLVRGTDGSFFVAYFGCVKHNYVKINTFWLLFSTLWFSTQMLITWTIRLKFICLRDLYLIMPRVIYWFHEKKQFQKQLQEIFVERYLVNNVYLNVKLLMGYFYLKNCLPNILKNTQCFFLKWCLYLEILFVYFFFALIVIICVFSSTDIIMLSK